MAWGLPAIGMDGGLIFRLPFHESRLSIMFEHSQRLISASVEAGSAQVAHAVAQAGAQQAGAIAGVGGSLDRLRAAAERSKTAGVQPVVIMNPPSA